MKIIRIVAWISSLFLSIQAFSYGGPSPIHKTAPIQKQALKRIIIDAGHGGGDVGARGRYSTEKDISLAVALKLEIQLKQALPDVEILMTRKTDVFNSVVEKSDIANRLKGDLFICIHVNSAGSRTVREINTPLNTSKKIAAVQRRPRTFASFASFIIWVRISGS